MAQAQPVANLNESVFYERTIYDLFNVIQNPTSRLFIDIRPQTEYSKVHVFHGVNIPITMSDDEIIDTFRDCFFFDSVYCYANQSQMDKKEHIAFYTRLESILANELNESGHKLYILTIAIEHFIEMFPFLCIKDDEQINNKNMHIIQLYFKRQYIYERYPNQIINNKLYLGNIQHAENKNILNNLQITHIVNVTTRSYKDKTILNGRKVHCVLVGDHQNANIAQHFEATYKFIHDAIEERKENNVVLVHCKEGRSRGPSIVISYLMKLRSLTFSECLQFVKNKREIIQPNQGFVNQLKNYEKHGYTVKIKDL